MRFWELVYHVCLSSFAGITWALSLASVGKGAWLRLKYLDWKALRFHPPAFPIKAVRRLLCIGEGPWLYLWLALGTEHYLGVIFGSHFEWRTVAFEASELGGCTFLSRLFGGCFI